MEDWILRDVTRAIVSCCHSEEDIRELLNQLSLVNWKEAIAAKVYECSLRPCLLCRKDEVSSKLRMIYDPSFRGCWRIVCPECADKAEFSVTCVICTVSQPSLSFTERDFVCRSCENIQKLVDLNNSRARVLKLPATLTTKQWGKTIRYFDNKCAYCSGPYECMEHYLPVLLKGGTTPDNCVPACYKCNTIKKDRHPDTLDNLFPAENLARIREYLGSQRQDTVCSSPQRPQTNRTLSAS
jgi:5-methylcytosine-specific restriction endonuclease McrA